MSSTSQCGIRSDLMRSWMDGWTSCQFHGCAKYVSNIFQLSTKSFLPWTISKKPEMFLIFSFKRRSDQPVLVAELPVSSKYVCLVWKAFFDEIPGTVKWHVDLSKEIPEDFLFFDNHDKIIQNMISMDKPE